MRRAVVLGSSGFLGAHCVEQLAARAGSAQVFALARRPEAGPPLPEGVAPLALDLAEPGALERWCRDFRPTCLLSLAALARAADCERDPELARAQNVLVPARLARIAKASGARLVHVSTDLVFGARPPAAGGFREDDEPAPLGAYGRTKAAGEAALLAVEPSALVVRLPLLSGPAHGRGLGATESVVRAVQSGRTPELFVDEWRTPLDVRDAAAALVELCAGNLAGRLHVAGPRRLARLELGLIALEAAGWTPAGARRAVRAAARSELATGAPRAADVSLDASRARALLATRLRDVAEAEREPWAPPRADLA